MKIGFVYDLRDAYLQLGFAAESVAEFDTAETIEGIAKALESFGGQVVLVGRGVALAERLVAGERFDLVFSIAEGTAGRSREAQVPALCELFDQPYVFSDPLTMAATLDKGVAKRLVRDAGLPTASFAVLASAADAAAWIDQAAAGGSHRPAPPWFVKPLAEGTGKGCSNASCVRTTAGLMPTVADLVSRFAQPALVEQYLPGREFTVGIIGEGDSAEVVAVLELTIQDHTGGAVYGYDNKQSLGEHFACRLAKDAEALQAGQTALAAYRALGCRDTARLDLRSDGAGVPHFLEANAIPGLKDGFSDLPILASLVGWSYEKLIARILNAACYRLGIVVPVQS